MISLLIISLILVPVILLALSPLAIETPDGYSPYQKKYKTIKPRLGQRFINFLVDRAMTKHYGGSK